MHYKPFKKHTFNDFVTLVVTFILFSTFYFKSCDFDKKKKNICLLYVLDRTYTCIWLAHSSLKAGKNVPLKMAPGPMALTMTFIRKDIGFVGTLKYVLPEHILFRVQIWDSNYDVVEQTDTDAYLGGGGFKRDQTTRRCIDYT